MALEPIIVSLLLSFGLNGLIYILAFTFQTDKLTDGTYSATFLLIAWYLFKQGEPQYYRIIIAAMVSLWAVRLGGYLAYRIFKKGRDVRFDQMRPVWWRFGGFWLLQAVSVWIISLPFVIALGQSGTAVYEAQSKAALMIGVILFLIGWLIEWRADAQKSKFKSNALNQNQLITTGLYNWVRFPNYLGEILVWVGIFISCIPVLEGWQWLSIISPLWIIYLLTRISGIPLLIEVQDKKYGQQEAYKNYIKKTKKLVPRVY